MQHPSANTLSVTRHRSGLGQEGTHDRVVADDERGVFALVSAFPRDERGMRAANLVADVLDEGAGHFLSTLDDLAAGRAPAIRFKEVLMQGLEAASATVRKMVRKGEEIPPPHVSATLILVHGGQAIVGHLGASRAYLLHRDKIIRLTRTDDSGANQASDPTLSPNPTLEALPSGDNSSATSFIGQAEPLNVDAIAFRIPRGDRLVILSPGLSGGLRGEAVRDLARANPQPDDLANVLMEHAGAAAGRSDVACVVTNISERRAAAPISEMGPPGETRPDLQAVSVDGPVELAPSRRTRGTLHFRPVTRSLSVPPAALGAVARETSTGPVKVRKVRSTHERIEHGVGHWTQIPLFAGLGDERLQRLHDLMAPITIHAEEPLYTAGEEADRLFILINGRLKELGGGEVIRLIEPMAVIGETALIEGYRRRSTMAATKLSRLMSLRVSQLHEVLASDHGLGVALFHNLSSLLAERLWKAGLGA